MTTVFKTSADIANRALQYLGQKRLAALTDATKDAQEIAACYNALRQAELQRNEWQFAIKDAVLRAVQAGNAVVGGITSAPTMLATFESYSAANTYPTGAVVTYTDGLLYEAVAMVAANVLPGAGVPWREYAGNITVQPYDTSGQTGYHQGELVYVADGDIAPDNDYPWLVFKSLGALNKDAPGTVTAWLSTAYYVAGQTVLSGGVTYMCSAVVGVNTNQTPIAAWAVGTTYTTGQTVLGTDGNIYTSVGNGNVGNNPVGDGGVHWTNSYAAFWIIPPATQPDVNTGSNWLQLGSTTVIQSPAILYPLGAGPVEQVSTQNIFVLPNAFLRRASLNPKLGNLSYLGRPGQAMVDDWVFEGPYMLSGYSDPVYMRFVADVTDVTTMNSMFCEMLALRIAEAVCETLTQSTEKKQALLAEYNKFALEARLSNAILAGAQEAFLDDFVACRL